MTMRKNEESRLNYWIVGCDVPTFTITTATITIIIIFFVFFFFYDFFFFLSFFLFFAQTEDTATMYCHAMQLGCISDQTRLSGMRWLFATRLAVCSYAITRCGVKRRRKN